MIQVERHRVRAAPCRRRNETLHPAAESHPVCLGWPSAPPDLDLNSDEPGHRRLFAASRRCRPRSSSAVAGSTGRHRRSPAVFSSSAELLRTLGAVDREGHRHIDVAAIDLLRARRYSSVGALRPWATRGLAICTVCHGRSHVHLFLWQVVAGRDLPLADEPIASGASTVSAITAPGRAARKSSVASAS